MVGNFVALELGEERILQAYPLVQSVYGDISMGDWVAFAGGRIIGRRDPAPRVARQGIVAAENRGGYLQGLFCYSFRPDAFRGPALVCDHFIALDLLGFNSPLSCLVAKAESLARENDSAKLVVRLPQSVAGRPAPNTRTHMELLNSGHELESLCFCKPLKP